MRTKMILVLWLAYTGMLFGQEQQGAGFYDFKVPDIVGKEYSFSQLKGKKVMIVNTASKCGLTPQYEELQKLYEEYGGDGFVILGFPANNFANQEPGSNEEIQAFCNEKYEVSFPLMSKVSVKGKDQHPLYTWLTQKSLNGYADSEVSWNFQKYLIDEKGNLVKVVPPRTKPGDPVIVDWLK